MDATTFFSEAAAEFFCSHCKLRNVVLVQAGLSDVGLFRPVLYTNCQYCRGPIHNPTIFWNFTPHSSPLIGEITSKERIKMLYSLECSVLYNDCLTLAAEIFETLIDADVEDNDIEYLLSRYFPSNITVEIWEGIMNRRYIINIYFLFRIISILISEIDRAGLKVRTTQPLALQEVLEWYHLS